MFILHLLLCLSYALIGKAYILSTHSNGDITLDKLTFW